MSKLLLPYLAIVVTMMVLDVIWIGVLAWLSAHALALFVRGPAVAPFDALSRVPGLRWRFFWGWSLLSAVMLAALPILSLAGLAVFHLVTNAEDLFGWRN